MALALDHAVLRDPPGESSVVASGGLLPFLSASVPDSINQARPHGYIPNIPRVQRKVSMLVQVEACAIVLGIIAWRVQN